MVSMEIDEDKNIYTHYATTFLEYSEPLYKKYSFYKIFNGFIEFFFKFNEIIKKIID